MNLSVSPKTITLRFGLVSSWFLLPMKNWSSIIWLICTINPTAIGIQQQRNSQRNFINHHFSPDRLFFNQLQGGASQKISWLIPPSYLVWYIISIIHKKQLDYVRPRISLSFTTLYYKSTCFLSSNLHVPSYFPLFSSVFLSFWGHLL